MSSLKIIDLQVWNQNGENATLFKERDDAISFAVAVDISPDLTKDLTVYYHVAFQVIESVTNQIIVNSVQRYQIPEDWPRWWLTVGNNWATPYSTADNTWGLTTADQPAIFGFRAILTASYWGGSGEVTVDAFDVSSVRWLQIESQGGWL